MDLLGIGFSGAYRYDEKAVWGIRDREKQFLSFESRGRNIMALAFWTNLRENVRSNDSTSQKTEIADKQAGKDFFVVSSLAPSGRVSRKFCRMKLHEF